MFQRSLLSILFLFFASPFLQAQDQEIRPLEPEKPVLEKGRSRFQPGPEKTPIPFTQTDFLRLTADPPDTAIYMGEPFVVRLRLVNHTDFLVHIKTNFNPRGALEVDVQKMNEPSRRYYGPYSEGTYTPNEYPTFPLEEFPIEVMVWGDKTTPNTLAFPEPGDYLVSIKLSNVGAELSGRQGPLELLDKELQKMPPFRVRVLPPDPEWKPLLDELIKLKAFPYLHLKRISGEDAPPGLREKFIELAKKYPATPLTPYLDYCIAIDAWAEAGADAEDNELFAIANNHYQACAAADSAYKSNALVDLVRLYDNRGMAMLAKQTSERLVREGDPFLKMLYGTQPFVKKYLRNSEEISPKAYWHILQ